jgi:hypothetical protein
MSKAEPKKQEEEFDVIDLKFALQQTMEDRDFLKELLQDMLKDEADKIAEMQDGIDNNDHTVGSFIKIGDVLLFWLEIARGCSLY